MKQFKQTLEVIAVHRELPHFVMNEQRLIVALEPGTKLWLTALSSHQHFHGLNLILKDGKLNPARTFKKQANVSFKAIDV